MTDVADAAGRDAARDTLLADRADAASLAKTLRRDLGGIMTATEGANTDDEHDPEGATIAFERAQVGAVLDQTERRLRDIDAALLRVEDGSYGVCLRCGSSVGEGRLQARPTAATCIACASARSN